MYTFSNVNIFFLIFGHNLREMINLSENTNPSSVKNINNV